MAELRVKSTGTLKLFESDNTSSITIASPASLGGDRTITLPDSDATLVGGTMSTFDPDGAVTINDSGADVDFRVESAGNTHMLFVDGGNNRVGICGSVILPTSILEVSQDVSAGSGINSLLTISATDGGVNMSGGEGPGILFRIPDDETNPSVGAQIGALKESADDSVSNTALSFSVSQNDETLDEAMRIDSAGAVTKPLTPAFMAIAAGQTNVTGDGTEYTVLFASSERFDQGVNFASPTFTAPVAGKYYLTASVGISGGSSSITYTNMYITTSNYRYDWFSGAGGNLGEGGSFKPSFSIIADMDASDTAVVKISCGGMGSDSLDVTDNSFFGGYLMC